MNARRHLTHAGVPRAAAALLAAALLALLALPTAAHAQLAPAGITDTVCAARAFRAFDYMAGSWIVRDTVGHVMGTNEITRAVDGCALHEHWATPRGERGESLTVYDAIARRWHQLYSGTGGFVLDLSGTFDGDRLVMTTPPQPSARDPRVSVIQRWSWQPLDSTHVRQEASVSRDGGLTWQPQFVGIYERRAG